MQNTLNQNLIYKMQLLITHYKLNQLRIIKKNLLSLHKLNFHLHRRRYNACKMTYTTNTVTRIHNET